MSLVSYDRPARGRIWDATLRGLIGGEEAFRRGYRLATDRVTKTEWMLINSYHAGTPPTGDFGDYVDTDTLDLSGEFRGSYASDGAVPSPALADYYWNTTHHHFRLRELAVQNFQTSIRWVNVSPRNAIDEHLQHVDLGKRFYWLSWADTEAELLLRVQTPIDDNGEYFGVADGVVSQLDRSTFVPAVNPWVTHDWEQIHPTEDTAGSGSDSDAVAAAPEVLVNDVAVTFGGSSGDASTRFELPGP